MKVDTSLATLDTSAGHLVFSILWTQLLAFSWHDLLHCAFLVLYLHNVGQNVLS